MSQLIVLVVICVLLYFVAWGLAILYRARGGIVWMVVRIARTIFAGVFLYAALTLFEHVAGYPPRPMVKMIGVAAVVAAQWNVRRSRYVRRGVRQEVIARDLKGEKYDGKTHHFDHRVPYSRGGSHTADNLRIVSRKKNLQKGAKMPRLRDLFFR